MNRKLRSVLLVWALVAAMIPFAAGARDNDTKEAFLKENPKAAPYVKTVEKLAKVLKAKQAQGFKYSAASKTKRGAWETNAEATAYVKGKLLRYEVERGGKPVLTYITDGTRMVIINAQFPQGRDVPNVKPQPQLILAPWYADGIRWVSFKQIPGMDGKKAPTLEGRIGEDRIDISFAAGDPGKIKAVLTKSRQGAPKKSATIEEYMKVDGVWVGKKLWDVDLTMRGEVDTGTTIKSIDWAWKPAAETFRMPAPTPMPLMPTPPPGVKLSPHPSAPGGAAKKPFFPPPTPPAGMKK